MIANKITVHCSASRVGRYMTASEIRKYHTDPKPYGKGWSDIGYHFVIRTDGAVEVGRPIYKQGAHVAGHNENNIGICLVGGLDRNGKPAFTYTTAQMNALYGLIMEKAYLFSIQLSDICGHRDFSPDLNGDGIITSNEFIKDCPCFDVQEWLKGMLVDNGVVEHGFIQ